MRTYESLVSWTDRKAGSAEQGFRGGLYVRTRPARIESIAGDVIRPACKQRPVRTVQLISA